MTDNNENTPMFTWNYRLIKRFAENGGTAYIQLCEVNYDAEGSLDGFAPVTSVYGEDEEDCRSTMRMMLQALTRPVLDELEFHNAERARGLSRMEALEFGCTFAINTMPMLADNALVGRMSDEEWRKLYEAGDLVFPGYDTTQPLK